LPTVTVHGDATPDQLPPPYAGGQVARGGRLGVLGNQDFMDVPFSMTTYTSQAIQNQQARSIAGVLADDPFIRSSYGFGNFSETYMVRGFQLTGDDLGWNGLFGIAPRQLVAAEAVDRVETFRAPARSSTAYRQPVPALAGASTSSRSTPRWRRSRRQRSTTPVMPKWVAQSMSAAALATPRSLGRGSTRWRVGAIPRSTPRTASSVC
jgi:hypothetical protein